MSVQVGDCGEGTIAPHTFSSPIDPVPVTPVNVNTQDACMSIVPVAEVASSPEGSIKVVPVTVSFPRAEVPTTPVVGAPVEATTFSFPSALVPATPVVVMMNEAKAVAVPTAPVAATPVGTTATSSCPPQ